MTECPYCQVKIRNDWMTDLPKGALDISLCSACGEIIAIESGAVRKLTADEHLAYATQEDVQTARRLWLEEQDTDPILDTPVFTAYKSLLNAARTQSEDKGTTLVYETIYLTAAVRTYESIQQLFARAKLNMPAVLVDRLLNLGRFLRDTREDRLTELERMPVQPKRRRGGLHN